MFLHNDLPEDLRIDLFFAAVVVAGASDAAEQSSADAVQLAVRDPVGLHKPPNLDEELAREGLGAADALGIGNEAEQPLRIPHGKSRHSTSKIRRMTNGLHCVAEAAFS